MLAQVSFSPTTKWNWLQLSAMLGCVGVGVTTPLVDFVDVVGGFVEVAGGLVPSCLMIETQAYASFQSPPQVLPAAGFQVRNCSNVIPNLDAIALHPSPSLTI
jgi:hypothetical protein